MSDGTGPTIVLLDGDHDNTLQIAKELSADLNAWIVGVGTNRLSRLFLSRYCDEREILPASGDADYGAALLALLRDRRPDAVLPAGYKSVAALDEIRDRIPDDVGLPLPPSDTLERAVDKRKTLSLAAEMGIDVPADYTARVAEIDERGRDPDALDGLPFPLFLKGQRETGEVLSSRVPDPATFWREYDALADEAGGDDVLVQECVEGDGRTYGCGLLFVDGDLRLSFTHAELRSVPRRGGSGTRVREIHDATLEATSVELLERLDWHGVALVEYRYTGDSYVLMEVNPKFWASYALASQRGYRFASTLIAETLDLPAPDTPTRAGTGERVFPLRELAYCLRNRERASLSEAAAAMLWPPAPPDVNLDDLFAWLVPPATMTEDAPRVQTALDRVDRLPGIDVPSERDVPAPDAEPSSQSK